MKNSDLQGVFMKIGKYVLVLVVLLSGLALTSCSKSVDDSPLNPDKPITVTVWHYYNGNTKEIFDALVSEFNETIGVDEGVVIDSQSQGDVNQLATAVFDAANQSIGAAPMPDIFASYPDNAYRVNKIVDLVSLDTYFSEEELSSYRSEFLEEGRFQSNSDLFIVPIAKSSENLFVNKNLWETFAREFALTTDDLKTWEGLYKVSKLYYEKTGKAFYSIDASANFMLEASMQLGSEMFIYNNDGTVAFNLTPEVAQKIWSYYYIPYISGYYVKTGRFSSDDAKTGTVLAYTGSTAGAAYFPTEVTIDQQEVYEIEPLALPYPYFEGGKPYAMQQGAGMCITQSDKEHEYAAAMFLKWFTDNEQNIEFAISTGYFPVKKEALKEETLLGALAKTSFTNPAIKASIITTNQMFQDYTLYNSKPFTGSYEMRVLLETNLYDKILRDLETVARRESDGENRDVIIDEMVSNSEFEKWYQEMLDEASLIMNN